MAGCQDPIQHLPEEQREQSPQGLPPSWKGRFGEAFVASVTLGPCGAELPLSCSRTFLTCLGPFLGRKLLQGISAE